MAANRALAAAGPIFLAGQIPNWWPTKSSRKTPTFSFGLLGFQPNCCHKGRPSGTLFCDTSGSMHNKLPHYGEEKWFRYMNVYNFDRVPNFRDCAGTDPNSALKCKDGSRMKRGMLFRTGQLTIASENDIQRLNKDFNVKTYIDLRCGKTFNSNAESMDGPIYDTYPPSPWLLRKEHQPEGNFVPRCAGECRRVHVDVHEGLQPVAGVNMTSTFEQMFMVGCLGCFTDPLPRRKLLDALEVLCEESNYPVMFGCTAGKDRTGVIALVVQKLLGVSDKDIIEEYMLSNLCNGHMALVWHLAKGETVRRMKLEYGGVNGAKDCLKALWLQEAKGKKELSADELQMRIDKFWSDMEKSDVPEEVILRQLSKLSYRDAEVSLVYVTIVKAMLAKIEEYGGIDSFLDDLGFEHEKRARIKRILATNGQD